MHHNNVAAVILAGGKGTRFSQFVGCYRQKVLYRLGEKPLIQYTTDLFDPTVVPHLVFNTGFRARDVRRWVKKQHFPHRISFSQQAGQSIYSAVSGAVNKTDKSTIVCCNADEIRLGLDMRQVLGFHRQHGRSMTIVGAYRNHLYRHRILIVDEDGTLLSSEYNPQRFRDQPHTMGLVNAGIAIFEKCAVKMFDAHHPSNGWGAMLDPLCRRREVIVLPEAIQTFFNVGTPEELTDARSFFRDTSLP